MPRELQLKSGSKVDWDGLINLTIIDVDQKSHRFEMIDAAQELKSISQTLNENEHEGTLFGLAVKRYIAVTYGVTVSLNAAIDYYNAVLEAMENGEDFFTTWLDSPTTTDSSLPPNGPPEESKPISA